MDNTVTDLSWDELVTARSKAKQDVEATDPKSEDYKDKMRTFRALDHERERRVTEAREERMNPQ